MDKGRDVFVFLDIDDTLLDFRKAEAIALSKALQDMDLEPAEATIARYSQINRQQWELLEEGLLTREQVLLRRFELLFAELGVARSAERIRDLYEGYLAIGHHFMPGAPELLEALHGRCRLFIASNGTAKVQASRIASAGIGPYFERIFVSEEMGHEKPSRAFFAACFAQISGFAAERAIIVGDSLSSDVRGGKNAGILSCWYNPDAKAPREEIRPDYVIGSLGELPALLARLFPESLSGV